MIFRMSKVIWLIKRVKVNLSSKFAKLMLAQKLFPIKHPKEKMKRIHIKI